MSETLVPEPEGSDSVASASASKDDALAALVASLQKQQNLPLAIVAGAVAALTGAVAWAVITVSTGYQIGWMAVGVGFLVGFSVRLLGKGVEQRFGYVGAAFALLGCLLGNLFSQVGFVATEYDAGFLDVLFGLTSAMVVEVYTATFSPIDLLFYGIAIYEGFKFSFQQMSEKQLAALGG